MKNTDLMEKQYSESEMYQIIDVVTRGFARKGNGLSNEYLVLLMELDSRFH